jgi:hypothetical protein
MTDPRMVKALVWDRGAFEIAVGKGEQGRKADGLRLGRSAEVLRYP